MAEKAAIVWKDGAIGEGGDIAWGGLAVAGGAAAAAGGDDGDGFCAHRTHLDGATGSGRLAGDATRDDHHGALVTIDYACKYTISRAADADPGRNFSKVLALGDFLPSM